MLKVFRSKESNDFFPHAAGRLLGVSYPLGRYYVAAPNKLAAKEALWAAGIAAMTTAFVLVRSNDPFVERTQAEGALDQSGDVVVTPPLSQRYVLYRDSRWTMPNSDLKVD